MARYHVKADGSMGVCTAQEGNCPYGGEEGTKHFSNKADAMRYAEQVIKSKETRDTSLRRSSSNGGGSKPPSTPTTEDPNDPSRKWIGKNLNQVIVSYTPESGFEPIPSHQIASIVREAAKGYEGDWEDGDASTPEESRDLDKMGRLAAALKQDPFGVRDCAAEINDPDQREALISEFNGIAENAGDDLGFYARGAQADLAWRRDGRPRYEDWVESHKDEAYYNNELAYEPNLFSNEDLSIEDLEERYYDLDGAMSELRDMRDDLDGNLNAAERYEAFDDARNDLDEAYGVVESYLDGVEEFDDPHYWDSEPNEIKQDYGRKLQEARKLLKDSEGYDRVIDDLESDWLADHQAERKRMSDDYYADVDEDYYYDGYL